MIVGVPKEIKTAENRVALVPAGGEALVGDGHSGLVEEGAGGGSGVGGGGAWGGGGGGATAGRGGGGGGARFPLLILPLARLFWRGGVWPWISVRLPPTRHNLLEQLHRADLVIGAVLLPGAKAPKLV